MITGKRMPFFVYILECADKTLYIGYTNDLSRRVERHNSKRLGAKYTRSRQPVVLRYSESFRTKSNAMRRECALKMLSRAEKLRLFS